jgi:acyl-CoA reductase-like NAD-dependent aldehyde dehydrogenase
VTLARVPAMQAGDARAAVAAAEAAWEGWRHKTSKVWYGTVWVVTYMC